MHVGVGTFYERLADSTSIPSPGCVTIAGEGFFSTRILSSDATSTVDWTNRRAVHLSDLTVTNLGNFFTKTGRALYATGGSRGNTADRCGFVHGGTDLSGAWDVELIGDNNGTNAFIDSLFLGYFSNANSVHFQPKPATCSNDPTRACLNDGDCSGGVCDTHVSKGSGDFVIGGGDIQVGWVAGGDAVWIEEVAWGNPFNVILTDLPLHGYAGGDGITTGLRVSLGPSNPNSSPALKGIDRRRVVVQDTRILGTDGLFGIEPFDVSYVLDNARLVVASPFSADHCRRSLTNGAQIVRAMNGGGANSVVLGGGPIDLGVLDCPVPPSPQNGEFWHSLAVNATATTTPTPTSTPASTPTAATPTRTRTPTPTGATATPTATPTPYGAFRAEVNGTLLDLMGLEQPDPRATPVQAGPMIARDQTGVARWRINHSASFNGVVQFQGLGEFTQLNGPSSTFLLCSNTTRRCLADSDPTLALELATKQYVDARSICARYTSDQSETSDATLGSDATNLSIGTVAAGTTYVLNGQLAVTQGGAGADFNFGLVVPGTSPVCTGVSAMSNAPNNVADSAVLSGCGSSGLDSVLDQSTGGTNVLRIGGTIVTGSGAGGGVTFEWAQRTSTASATVVKAGSVICLTPM